MHLCGMMQEWSYWEREHILQADVLIIGTGLTGLYTALELLEREQGKRVVLVDRGAFSAGASTRNAGFACFGNVSEILDDMKHDSEEVVFELMRDRYDGLKKTARLLGENRIGLEFKGSHEVFTKANSSAFDDACAYIPRANEMFREICGLHDVFTLHQKPQQLPFQNTIGAIANPYEGHLQTGLLYKSLWQRCSYAGATIYGGMQILGLSEKNGYVEADLGNGMVFKAGRVLICNNAFAAQLVPELPVVPARGQILITESFEHDLKGIYHYDHGYYYWRDLGDRILLGGARNSDFDGEHTSEAGLNELVQTELERFLREEILGREGEVPKIEMRWSGIMGFGPSKRPVVTQISDRVWAAVRLGGMGVALSSVLASRLVRELSGDL